MIIVELSCGLGNQMFQYAVARQLQEQRKDDLFFNLNQFEFDEQRDYSLGHFNILPDIKILPTKMQKRYGLYSRFLASFLNKIHMMHGEKAFYRVVKHGFFSTFDIFNYYGNYSCRKKKIYIRGSFQSAAYFKDVQQQLKNEFQIIEPIEEKNIDIYNQITADNSVCVHIRRGDYLTTANDRKLLNVCSEEYYREAMRRIAANEDNPVFYIFSNTHEDIEWIKQNYQWEYDVKYVDQSNCDYEEFRLMVNCKHFIISNSTFSWWAQYLSDNQGKRVIAPSIWYNGNGQDACDIYMDSWEIVEIN